MPEPPPVAAVTIALEVEEAPTEVAEPDAVAVMVDEPVTPPVAAVTIGCATGFATWTGLVTAVGTGATDPTCWMETTAGGGGPPGGGTGGPTIPGALAWLGEVRRVMVFWRWKKMCPATSYATVLREVRLRVAPMAHHENNKVPGGGLVVAVPAERSQIIVVASHKYVPENRIRGVAGSDEGWSLWYTCHCTGSNERVGTRRVLVKVEVRNEGG